MTFHPPKKPKAANPTNELMESKQIRDSLEEAVSQAEAECRRCHAKMIELRGHGVEGQLTGNKITPTKDEQAEIDRYVRDVYTPANQELSRLKKEHSEAKLRYADLRQADEDSHQAEYLAEAIKALDLARLEWAQVNARFKQLDANINGLSVDADRKLTT